MASEATTAPGIVVRDLADAPSAPSKVVALPFYRSWRFLAAIAALVLVAAAIAGGVGGSAASRAAPASSSAPATTPRSAPVVVVAVKLGYTGILVATSVTSVRCNMASL